VGGAYWHHLACVNTRQTSLVTTPRFIVSTGRCGSSLLGALLGAHPAILNLSELFAAVQPGAFPHGTISGTRFWAMLSEPRIAWTVALAHRLEPLEFKYPVDAGSRFDRQSGVPPIAGVCLATLTKEPDVLYEELEHTVPRFQAAEVGSLYSSLFDWLTDRLQRRVWVERSGGSLAYAGVIADSFRHGKFVHLYRDGCETALSMSRHPFFRMAVVRQTLAAHLKYDPYDECHPQGGGQPLPLELERLLPATFDGRMLRQVHIPIERFGRYWSAMILHGTNALGKLSDADVLHISYDDVVCSPRAALQALFEFFELPAPSSSWLLSAVSNVHAPNRALPQLPIDERKTLARACAPGQRRLDQLSHSSP
jgi:hypothetical protein